MEMGSWEKIAGTAGHTQVRIEVDVGKPLAIGRFDVGLQVLLHAVYLFKASRRSHNHSDSYEGRAANFYLTAQ